MISYLMNCVSKTVENLNPNPLHRIDVLHCRIQFDSIIKELLLIAKIQY